jgi:PhzF family phenazine biosynthesis protein
LEAWICDKLLQSIASETNLSETAFLVSSDNCLELRWFTPKTEVVLCGHATLASAFVQFFCLNWHDDTIQFQTRKSGQLTVTRRGEFLEIDLPARLVHAQKAPDGLGEALEIAHQKVFGSEGDLMIVLDSERAVLAVQLAFTALEASRLSRDHPHCNG